MGLVLALIVAGAFTLVATPAALTGVALLVRNRRHPVFWRVFLPTTLVALVLQYAYALAPFAFLRTGEYSWDLFMAPMLGWHLVAVPAAALAIWFTVRENVPAWAAGVVSGLLVSTAAVVILALPLAFVLTRSLRLTFRP